VARQCHRYASYAAAAAGKRAELSNAAVVIMDRVSQQHVLILMM
jgi:hypothetical protein